MYVGIIRRRPWEWKKRPHEPRSGRKVIRRVYAGIQMAPPYRFDLRGLTRDGENSITIEAATTLERERGRTKDAAPTGITGEVAPQR